MNVIRALFLIDAIPTQPPNQEYRRNMTLTYNTTMSLANGVLTDYHHHIYLWVL